MTIAQIFLNSVPFIGCLVVVFFGRLFADLFRVCIVRFASWLLPFLCKHVMLCRNERGAVASISTNARCGPQVFLMVLLPLLASSLQEQLDGSVVGLTPIALLGGAAPLHTSPSNVHPVTSTAHKNKTPVPAPAVSLTQKPKADSLTVPCRASALVVPRRGGRVVHGCEAAEGRQAARNARVQLRHRHDSQQLCACPATALARHVASH